MSRHTRPTDPSRRRHIEDPDEYDRGRRDGERDRQPDPDKDPDKDKR